MGHVPDLRQSPFARATANRKDRDARRGRIAGSALPTLLHNRSYDWRTLPRH